MTLTERLVLKELANSLANSTGRNWTYGDVTNWSDYAKQMASVIETVVPVLEKLTGKENKEES